MRINTEGNKEWRNDLFDETADSLGENTKTKAITRACEHTKQDIEAKRELLDYMTDNLSPSAAADICDILSTSQMDLSIDVNSSVDID